MKQKELFNILQGEWEISRNILNKQQPSVSPKVQGRATVKKITDNKLSYKEELELLWQNSTLTKAHKEYEYVRNEKGNLTLYNRVYEEVLPMFEIFFDPQDKQIARGEYWCNQDNYKATYEITSPNTFTLLFEVKGMDKDYSILSIFTRLEETPLLGIDT